VKPLRVAFVAGSLTQGGAEKQFLYMARALRDSGAEVDVYSLTRGEYYEAALIAEGIRPIWVGRWGPPPARLAALAPAILKRRPHIVQSTHFFGNLYAAMLGRLSGALGIGSIRNDAYFDMGANGRWGPWLLRMPQVLLANSWAAQHNAETMGVRADRIHVLPNVIDLGEFDRSGEDATSLPPRSEAPTAIAVCRLVAMKRLDRFIAALALARQDVPALRGLIVGDGPERGLLERLAADAGLNGGCTFVGRSDRVPRLLRQADMLVLSSEHEGFPNVVLEAMAARLPVVATPAGDVRRVVADGETGYVVPSDDVGAMAARMVRLATSPTLRHELGNAGRARVEQSYSFSALGGRLRSIYCSMASDRRDVRALAVLQ
jgi:glycosyltransferase involved in cell wall biosynthesis